MSNVYLTPLKTGFESLLKKINTLTTRVTNVENNLPNSYPNVRKLYFSTTVNPNGQPGDVSILSLWYGGQPNEYYAIRGWISGQSPNSPGIKVHITYGFDGNTDGSNNLIIQDYYAQESGQTEFIVEMYLTDASNGSANFVIDNKSGDTYVYNASFEVMGDITGLTFTK